jgi:hypothetical protein
MTYVGKVGELVLPRTSCYICDCVVICALLLAAHGTFEKCFAYGCKSTHWETHLKLFSFPRNEAWYVFCIIFVLYVL